MEGPNLTQLARAFALAEPVIRELTIKLDPRLVEPILANARGEHFTGPAGAEGSDDESTESTGEAVAETADA